MSNLIKKIRIQSGDAQIDYKALANLPTSDKTLTQEGSFADAKEVGDRLSELSATVNDLKENGTGTTVTGGSVKTILENMMTIMKAQVNEDGKPQLYNPDVSSIVSQTDRLIANLGTTDDGGEVEPDIPDEPDNPEVTLSSISATYTGGEVVVGTALTDLTGITVKATYSDGSTKNVTGYTLSGTIAEGNNTITVSYGGKATTFTVVGIVESESLEQLYTFEDVENSVVNNQNNTRTANVTVNNGNHVRVTSEAASYANWFWDINISSLATNGQSVSDITDSWFTIPSGATAKLCLKNVSLTNPPHQIRASLGATDVNNILRFVNNGEVETNEHSITVESDMAVPCITFSMLPTQGPSIEIEFDVELYVDGVRWI